MAGDVGRGAVAGYATELADRSPGTLPFEAHDVVVAEGHDVGLVKDLAERDGRTLAMNDVHVWRRRRKAG